MIPAPGELTRDDLVRGVALLVASVALVSFAPQTSDMAQLTLALESPNVVFPYPPLAELTYAVMHVIAPTPHGIAILNGIAQAVAALWVVVLLRRSGAATRVWFAAPILLLVGQNLDGMTALWLVAGVAEWRAGRTANAGMLLGLGAAFRISPAVILLPLAVASGRRGGLRMVASGAAAWLAVNVPYALIDFDRWREPYQVANTRGDFRGTVWSAMVGSDELRTSMSAALTLGVLVLIAIAVARHHLTGELAAALSMAAFIVLAKVWQPHYVLWLVLLLAFVPRVHLRWARALDVASIAYFVVLWRRLDMTDPGPWLWLTGGARLIALVGLVVWLLRDRSPRVPADDRREQNSTAIAF